MSYVDWSLASMIDKKRPFDNGLGIGHFSRSLLAIVIQDSYDIRSRFDANQLTIYDVTSNIKIVTSSTRRAYNRRSL